MHEYEVSMVPAEVNDESVARMRDYMLADLPMVMKLYATGGLKAVATLFKEKNQVKIRKAFVGATRVPSKALEYSAKYICATRSLQHGRLQIFVPCAALHYRVEGLINCQLQTRPDWKGGVVQFRKADCVYAKDTRNVHVLTQYGPVTVPLDDINAIEAAPLDDVVIPTFAVDRIYQVVEIYTTE